MFSNQFSSRNPKSNRKPKAARGPTGWTFDPRILLESLQSRTLLSAVELVADINLTSSPAVRDTMVEMNGAAYFAGNDGIHGWELWRTDGTAAGTTLVKDIFPGDSAFASISGTQFVNANGTLFFRARTAANGLELWKSDGTEAGTVLVKDIAPGILDSNIVNLTSVGGTVFFTANDGVNGFELWKSDGTEAGTVLVRDISVTPGTNSSPANLTNVNGTLFFRANDGVNGIELWKSDGTEAGTVLVKNINPAAGASSSPTSLINYNGTLFFSASDGVTGTELWKSDGTDAGTVLVKNINITPSSAGSNPSGLTNVNGTLYFSASDGLAGTELWKSDGTGAGTVLVKNINTATPTASSSPGLFTNVNGTLYFRADDGFNGSELWKSDGTSSGTILVKDIHTAPATSSFPSLLTNVNGTLFFSATDATNGTELWMSDGTDAGTILVQDIKPGLASSSPATLIHLNGSLLFSADNGVNGVELWRSDGTGAGTSIVKDINTVGTNGGGPVNLVEASGSLYYVANDGVQGQELWKTDLTTLASGLVKDINPGAANGITNFASLVLPPLASFAVQNTISVNGQMYFVASDPVNGTALWTTDGTEAGTRMVKDINPSTVTGESIFFNLVDFNGTLFFAANDGVGGADLWKSDGTEAGTVMVKNFGSGGVNAAQRMAIGIFNNSLYFAAVDGINGSELWKSDGTEAGTVMVKDINPGTAGSAPSRYTVVNGSLYFVAGTAANGTELWKTDGTAGGTVLVKDIRPGTTGSMLSGLQGDPWLTEFNGTLYFTANDGVSGTELWTSDGTAAGTNLVKDIRPGNVTTNPHVFLTRTSGGLFFFADNGVTGYEPWTSDGTAAGTTLLVDVNPGITSSQPFVSSATGPAQFTFAPGVLNGAVYFQANDGVNGAEVWKSDGTVAGTVRVTSHVPADFTPAGTSFANINGTLYFSSIDLVNGFELWRINEDPTAHAGGPYTVAEGESVVLDGTLSSDPNQPADSLKYEWDLDGDGIFGETGADAPYGDEVGATPTFSSALFESAAMLTIQLRVTDNGTNGGLSHTATTTLEITPVNDAPVVTVSTTTQTTAEDVAVTIHGILVADVDVLDETGQVRVTLSVDSGTLTVSSAATGGLSAGQISSNGTDAVVLEGPIAAVNLTLAAGVTYQGVLNFNGTDTLLVEANDLGNTGAGGAMTTSASVAIHVQSPAEQMDHLRLQVEGLYSQGTINQGQTNSLLKKLDHAHTKVAEGKTKVTYNSIGALRNEVRALVSGGVLTPNEGTPLVAAIDLLLRSLAIGGGF